MTVYIMYSWYNGIRAFDFHKSHIIVRFIKQLIHIHNTTNMFPCIVRIQPFYVRQKYGIVSLTSAYL